jgi:4-amino-4-deoxy-L-arabinose transferase-like glycosyltransferase
MPGNNAMRPGGGPGGGFMNTGNPGALRLFIPPLSKETSWLLPFGLVSIILLAVGSRWQWPIAPKHQALILWGGWLITCAIFFSIAGFFHEYYLAMMGPPLAALVAIGISRIWDLTGTRPWLAISLLGLSVTGTVAFQIYTATSFVQNVWWLSIVVSLLIIGLTALAIMAINRKPRLGFVIGFMLLGAAMFLTPGIWSVYTNLSASQNQSLPSAYSGGNIGPVEQGDLRINQELLDYLEANTKNMKYLMAVPSAMQGADYVLATGRPVLYMGGFNGQDNVVSVEDLARMVSAGELRYIYGNAAGGGPGGDSDISAWVASACTPVEGFNTATQNFGAPDGTTANSGGAATGPNNRFPQNSGGPQGNMLVSLYDCGNQ